MKTVAFFVVLAAVMSVAQAQSYGFGLGFGNLDVFGLNSDVSTLTAAIVDDISANAAAAFSGAAQGVSTAAGQLISAVVAPSGAAAAANVGTVDVSSNNGLSVRGAGAAQANNDGTATAAQAISAQGDSVSVSSASVAGNTEAVDAVIGGFGNLNVGRRMLSVN